MENDEIVLKRPFPIDSRILVDSDRIVEMIIYKNPKQDNRLFITFDYPFTGSLSLDTFHESAIIAYCKKHQIQLFEIDDSEKDFYETLIIIEEAEQNPQ